MADPKYVQTHFVDRIPCPHCAEVAHLIRHAPNAFKRDGSEVLTFQCVNGHTTSKSSEQ